MGKWEELSLIPKRLPTYIEGKLLCVGTARWLDKLNLVTSTKACQSIFLV